MNINRTAIIASTLCLLFALPASALPASPRKVTVDQQRLATLPAHDQQRVLFIADRLGTILEVDRSTLTRPERRAVRNEVNTLKNEAEAYNRAAGGTVIYISGAGLILIIILLIILL